MIQAARSCKQNIVEGSRAGIASAETELKLTNVARTSLDELLEDYQDFLRVHELSNGIRPIRKLVMFENSAQEKLILLKFYRKLV